MGSGSGANTCSSPSRGRTGCSSRRGRKDGKVKRKAGEPEEIEVGEELSACPRCGYGAGFHVAFRRRGRALAVFLICPSCSARFTTGSGRSPPANRQGGDTPERLGGDTPQRITRSRNVPPGRVPGERSTRAPKNRDVPENSSVLAAGRLSCDPIWGAVSGFRILGGGSLASSLDLRCTRKSALDLSPGKLRSDPSSFGCSAAYAPCGECHQRCPR